jgi:tetratricopeptide (TPR) repeat protein
VSKRKPNQSKDPGPARGPARGPQTPGTPESPPSSTHKWLFRLALLVLSPLLLLALPELGLRLAGYGYSTAFFKPLKIGNRDCLVENDKFGLRFFPPELARIPPPVVMEASKGPQVRRLFLLGESAALGDPRPAYGAGRYLQVLLEERFPGTKFEVICGAVTAINSHGVLPIARECARRQGDLWIVYMGNNEMVGPFGAATIFGSQAPPLWRVRLSLALQQTRVGQFLMALARKAGAAASHGPSWGGMQMFMENRIAPSDPRKEVVYRSFRRNLEDIVRAGRAARVPILLSTVAVNLKDCPPFGSVPDAALSDANRKSQGALCAEAAQAEEKADFAGALKKLEAAARLDPTPAELQFRLGQCLLSLQSTVKPIERSEISTRRDSPQSALDARDHFERARDDDALPFRADSRVNAIIRQVGAQFAGPGLALCDAEAVFAANSPVGIAGKEAFYEHVHLNFDGNYLLARAWAAAAERLLPPPATNAPTGDWASQEVCERRLALTAWNRYAVLEDVLHRLSLPPFTGQLQHSQHLESVRSDLRAIRRTLDRNAAADARQVCLAALERAPDDHRLHENTAEFLERIGDLQAAAAQWQQVIRLIPHHHVAYFQAGRLLARSGDLATGRALLSKSLALRPDLAEGWLELGNVQAAQMQPQLALQDYQRGIQLAPQDYRMYYQAGRALSKLKRGPDAIQNFRHALELRPDYWEGRYALGEELAFAGQSEAARREFEEVLRLKPGYAMAHLNLGVALVREKDLDNALRHFEEAARLDPTNQLAREYIEKLQARRK